MNAQHGLPSFVARATHWLRDRAASSYLDGEKPTIQARPIVNIRACEIVAPADVAGELARESESFFQLIPQLRTHGHRECARARVHVCASERE
eukprot:6177033-Pleurochrysis_carterae.AAC.2